MQWMTLFKKEMLENWRNFKWIWVPLVITLLAIMDPITTYYMPVILDSVGGLPEGAVFEMPEPPPVDVIMMSLGQLSSLGILIIALISMGTIAGEIKSGVSELVLVKPVNYFSYITSKWTSLLLIVWISLIVAMTTSWYYINLLFGEITFTSLLYVIFFYGLWLSFVITLSIFYGTLFKVPGLVAAMTILTTIGMSIITSLFGKHLTWSPNNLSQHIQKALLNEMVSSDLMITAIITISLIIVLLISSYFTFRKKELIN